MHTHDTINLFFGQITATLLLSVLFFIYNRCLNENLLKKFSIIIEIIYLLIAIYCILLQVHARQLSLLHQVLLVCLYVCIIFKFTYLQLCVKDTLT